MFHLSFNMIQLFQCYFQIQIINNLLFHRNFLAYKWGMEAFMIAHDQMVKGRKDLLIVILKEKINVGKLPAALRVYISKFS